MNRRSRTHTSFGQGLMLIGLGFAVAALLLLITEWSLGLLGLGDELLYEDPFVGFAPGKDVFEKVVEPTGESVYRTSPPKLAFFNAQEFPAEKSEGTYRIFSLGGSTTAGRPYDDRVSFSNWLRLYLPEIDPDRQWEVVNAGAISYASYRVVVLMKEILRYEPDLILVYTGHNEFLEERSYREIIHQNPALKRLRIWLGGLRFYAIARQFWLDVSAEQEPLAGNRLEAEVEAKLDSWTGLERYERDEELREAIIEHFDYNLRQIAAMARANGVEVIFIEPISNLKDFSPFKSQPTENALAADIEKRGSLLIEARGLLEHHRTDAGLEILNEAASIDPDFAETYFLLGRAQLAAGNIDAARSAFIRAKELDVAPLRALEPILAAISQVAADFEFPWIDLPRLLDSPIPGNEQLLDHVHPDVWVHSLIAEEVLRVLVDKDVIRPRASWSSAVRQGIFDRHLASLDRGYYGERDLNLAKVLGWAGKVVEAEAPLRRAVEVLPDNPEVHLNLGIVLQKQDRWDEAVGELQTAIDLQPDLPEAYFNLGVVYGALERTDAAIAELERAVELRPDYAEAWFNLGVLRRQQGDLETSIATLQRALELEPDAAETYLQLGFALRKLARWDEATIAFEQCLQRQPENSRAQAGLAATLAAQGDLEAALSRLQQALETDPNNPEAYFELGAVYRRRREVEEAVTAYRKAVEIAPDYAEAHNNLGVLLAESGDPQAASREFLAAIDSEPDYAEALFNLGVLYDGVGRSDDAIRAIRQAVELEPRVARFRLALGLLVRAHGDETEALEHLQEAQRLGADLPLEIERWIQTQ